MEKETLEIEEMREQLNILKEKLQNETLLNDALLRKATKSMLSGIQRQTWGLSIFTLLAIPFCAWTFHHYNFSWWHIGFTSAMLLFCLVCGLIQHWKLGTADVASSNLLECSRKLKKLKSHYVEWLKIAIPLMVLWLSWTITESVIHSTGKEMIAFVAGVVVGGVTGGIIGNKLRVRMIRKLDEIITMIEA